MITKTMKFAVLVSFLFIAFSSSSKEISVMTYNVENLFDTIHDEGKEDWTYMPLRVKKRSAEVQKYCKSVFIPVYKKQCYQLDWSNKTLTTKIKRLSKVIKSYNNGDGPDIIVFQEVENANVLNILREKGLKKMGYKELVLIEGPDKRGIDIGILSKYKLSKKAKYHKIDLKLIGARRTTRGILEASFKIGRKRLTIFGNHWPSQGNGDEHRELAGRTLRKAVLASKAKAIIAVGDFNTVPNDKVSGIKKWLVNKNLSPRFIDSLSENNDPGMPGTHNYRGKWNYLDRIFVLNNHSDYMEPHWDTLEILGHDFMLNKNDGTPKRFAPKSGAGFSDHLPMVMKFSL